MEKDNEAVSYYDDQMNPPQWKISRLKGASFPPPLVVGDTAWKVKGESYVPSAPVVYVRKDIPFVNSRVTVSGTKYETVFNYVFPVPELAQVYLGAPAVVRISASVHTPNAGLRTDSDGGLLIDLGEAFRNIVILPLVRVFRTQYYLKYVVFAGANLAKITPDTKIHFSFRPYWNVYPSKGAEATLRGQVTVTPDSAVLEGGDEPFTEAEFDHFCCKTEIIRCVDEIKGRYFLGNLSDFEFPELC